jgi:hypothetical protein
MSNYQKMTMLKFAEKIRDKHKIYNITNSIRKSTMVYPGFKPGSFSLEVRSGANN